MAEPLRIPPDALSGMDGWNAGVVYAPVPERTTWRLCSPSGELRYLKISLVGQELSLAIERDRMEWARTQLPVPRVLDYGCDGQHEWLLTAGLDGVNATDRGLRADVLRLVTLLAEGLRRFHAASVDTCPFDSRLDVMMRAAQRRVAAGQVDAEGYLRPIYGNVSAEAALTQLIQLRPMDEDLVVCHNDYCPPNVLISNGQVSGYVDLGQLGVADRWADLAVATRCVTWNYGPGWEDLFLAVYGIKWDHPKVAFYRLLADLGP